MRFKGVEDIACATVRENGQGESTGTTSEEIACATIRGITWAPFPKRLLV
jgi:hypothetical protein